MIRLTQPASDDTRRNDMPYMRITGTVTNVTGSCTHDGCGAASSGQPAYQWAQEHIDSTGHTVKVLKADIETYSPVVFPGTESPAATDEPVESLAIASSTDG